MQVTFTEYAAPTGSGFSQYEFYLKNLGDTEISDLRLVDDGSILVAVGPVNTATLYLGAWTPNNGTHVVHFTIDAGGVPTLYVDGVLIPLVQFFVGPVVVPVPANTASAYFTSGSAFPYTAVISKYFVASGVLPPTTAFCCT
jgi:hypothetical protein